MSYRDYPSAREFRCELFSKWYYPPFARVNPRRTEADYFRNGGGMLLPEGAEGKRFLREESGWA